MTGEEIKAIRQRAGLTQSGLASFLRITSGGRYVRMLESGDREASGPVSYLLELLDAGTIKPD